MGEGRYSFDAALEMPVYGWWRVDASASLPHVGGTITDNEQANERTFLAYLRTALAFSMIGVVVAQLYRLQHSQTPDPVFGYYLLSKPIACIFQASALCMTILGTIRFFRQQTAMSIGKINAGGWEILMICSGVFLVRALFVQSSAR